MFRLALSRCSSSGSLNMTKAYGFTFAALKGGLLSTKHLAENPMFLDRSLSRPCTNSLLIWAKKIDILRQRPRVWKRRSLKTEQLSN